MELVMIKINKKNYKIWEMWKKTVHKYGHQ